MTSQDIDPILVIGAGPVGLAAALSLSAEGLPVRVLEAGPANRERPGSRAIYVHRETLLALEAVAPGLGWEICRNGLTWQTKRTFYAGREVFAKSYRQTPPGVMPPSTSLAQVRTEALMLDACKASEIDFIFDAEVSELQAEGQAVHVKSADGREWRAPYVIGADGARSGVRAALGIPLEGSKSANSFIIVDLEEDPDKPLPAERTFHYNHPAVDGRNVLLVPFAGGWRADLALRPDDDAESFNDREGVRSWLTQVMPEAYADRIAWVSTYQFLQVIARDFADPSRRVLLIGEAAHLFAPFGARGMNSGIPDARSAAAAVGVAVRGGSQDEAVAAVADFATKRRAAAEYNRRAAGAALDHMQSRRPAMRAKRNMAARLAAAGLRAGAWLDSAPYGPRARDRGHSGGTY